MKENVLILIVFALQFFIYAIIGVLLQNELLTNIFSSITIMLMVAVMLLVMFSMMK